jgi:hypothetical protein
VLLDLQVYRASEEREPRLCLGSAVDSADIHSWYVIAVYLRDTILIQNRFICSFHPHDGSEEEGIEGATCP